jgi:hypothetical protein
MYSITNFQLRYDRLPQTCEKRRFVRVQSPKKELDKPVPESVDFAPLLSMKNSPLITILLALLAISAALSLYFCYAYIRKSGQIRGLQFQVNVINQRNAGINTLMNDVIEYSKHTPNHDIDRVLESFGLTNRPPAAK